MRGSVPAGAVNVAWEGAKGWNGLTVSIAAKGKAKVAGTLAGGAKAGKVAVKNGVVDDSGAGANPSALKLAYTAKSGAFKGSFKAYALANGKL